MTNNDINKYIPESVKKPTFTVSYFNESEWNKNLTPEELKQQELVSASYQNEIDSQERGYGPCTSSGCKHFVTIGYGKADRYEFFLKLSGSVRQKNVKITGLQNIKDFLKKLKSDEIKIVAIKDNDGKEIEASEGKSDFEDFLEEQVKEIGKMTEEECSNCNTCKGITVAINH